MISITEPFDAEFQCGSRWQHCRVVSVTGDQDDLQFVVIVNGPTCYVDTVGEVRRVHRPVEL